MKRNTEPTPHGGISAQASFGLGSNRDVPNCRKTSIVGALLGKPLIGVFRMLLGTSRLLGAMLATVFGAIARPLGLVLAQVVVFGAAGAAIVHLGNEVTRGAFDRSTASRIVERIGAAIASPSSPTVEDEDEVPRAVAYGYTPGVSALQAPRYPTDAEAGVGGEPRGFVDVLEEVAEKVASLLPDIGSSSAGYPSPPGLPLIEGKVLAKAGGDRIQSLITQVLNSMHQVEASGRLELVGDNGLAFGPLQVRHEPCEDLAKFFGAEINPKDCNGDWLLSEYVVRLYTGFWARELEKKTGQSVRGEEILRIWNGGPDMGPMSKTDLYVAKAVKFDRKVANIAAVAK